MTSTRAKTHAKTNSKEAAAAWTDAAPIAWGALASSFERHLRATNKSPKTISNYSEAVRQLGSYLAAKGMPQDLGNLRRGHVESYIDDLLNQRSSATARNRFASLQQFFHWAVDEGEVKNSPMAKMKPPKVSSKPPRVLSMDDLKKLVATCEKGSSFEARRDYAILRTFITTGCRRAEISNLELDDIDLDRAIMVVTGKGDRTRALPLNPKTVRAIDRYLRKRPVNKYHASNSLWLGRNGPMTHWGVEEIVNRRAKQAGLTGVSLHTFRHTWTDQALRDRTIPETDLMELGGWKSRQMLERYGAAARQERAVEAGRHLSIDERL
jgi:site-specific recombinase XerD